ncbi:MAG: AMP-binding protein [Acidobacteria bacterium]|nr:AMP-binding protein [Acidobacteriota bacterium]MBI3655888.1 AMP-binding protein [Acidobacteriota bacterium]
MNKAQSPTTLLELLNTAPDDKLAIVLPDSGLSVTYQALRLQVAAVADAFAGHGISRGERIALALPNGLPAIVCFLAASSAGTAAPLNPAYQATEFRFYMDDIAARTLIIPRQGGEDARRAAAERIPILTADMDAQGTVTIEPRSPGGAAGSPGAEDVALVLHTSGSTGRPKRVPLKHRHLVVSARNIVETYRLGPEDVTLCVMPLFHVHGLVASVLATLLSGGTVVVPSRFNPRSFRRLVQDHRVTWYSAVPTIHQILLARAVNVSQRPYGAETLRFIRSCSAPFSPETMRQMEDRFGVPVLEAYGMTEAAHQMASNPLPPGARKPGSVGPGTGLHISIMDDEGQPCPTGQIGEVVIRGPSVIESYENNPEADAGAFVQGWFRTGDQGLLDSDGYLWLTGRLKELINRGGEKISPHEIDNVLQTHPAVAEAVCFGVPHPTWGEAVAAAVVLRAPAHEADLLSFCRARLAEFKRPTKIYIVDTIPRTVTGKLQRRAMADACTKGAI